MKIAITGGNGFIGARLSALLQKEGHQVVSIDTHGPTPVDILDRDALTKACMGCDTIYHLAAAHRDDIFPRSLYYDINGTGTKNVIDAANASGITQIIFTSTFAVYGLNTGMPTEDSDLHPFNDYGKSKLEAEQHLKLWAKADPSRTLTIVRPVVVFGEGNRGNVHTLISQIVSGKFVMIGNGRNKKSMAYVGNVAAFLKHCLNEEPGFALYNYADKPDFDMQTLTDVVYKKLGKTKPTFALPYVVGMSAGYMFDILARVSGKNFPISSVRVQKFCADTTCAADRCRTTGFMPDYTLAQGLERMIDHDFLGKISAPEQQKAKAA
jgi:nucleoside-diphosphate-sugar epimerase